MQCLRVAFLAALLAGASLAQTVYSLGEGAPSPGLQALFEQAYFRGDFPVYASLPPLTLVTKLGATGLQQLVPDATKTGARLALIKAEISKPVTYVDGVSKDDVFQMRAALYAAWSPIGVSTAGYPTNDTRACPYLEFNSCEYNFFSKNFAIFSFATLDGLTSGGNLILTVADPIYTFWTTNGGLTGLGVPLSSAEAVTSGLSTVTATEQHFQMAGIVSLSSGTLNGRSVLIREPFRTAWKSGGYLTRFGLPIAEEQRTPDGRRRLAFEGGVLETAADGSVIIRTQVRSIVIPGAPGPFRMKVGETLNFRVILVDADGQEITDRIVSWSTSNGRVATVEQSQGLQVTVRAVGSGTANLTAVSDGRLSTPASIVVSSPCCQAGEGAPSAALAQAFQDTITRNRLSLVLPTPTPARRVGAGFVQEFVSTQSQTIRYVIAVSEARAVGYYLTGPLLVRYEQLGGAAGSLGFPQSDPSPGGRQEFVNRAALAGNPIRLVSGAILDRWRVAGFETGAAGPPSADPEPFFTFSGAAGAAQVFEKGVIYTGQAGPHAGRTYFVSGALLARYLRSGGPAGALGMPLGEAIVVDGRRRQEFEGGFIEQGPNDAEASVVEKNRQPSITATPNPVPAGGKVRIAAGGFPNGALLRITAGAQPAFTVLAQSGAHVWTVAVPSSARSETVRIRAVSGDGVFSAEGSYDIRALADLRLTLGKVAGDGQTGAPGTVLPVRLRVSVRDASGNPVPNVPVTFQPSPGAAIVNPLRASGADGDADAALRLPPNEGVALATASVSGQVVTFSARGAAVNLTAFPRLSQDVPGILGNSDEPVKTRGALLAAVASILRYHQDRRELPTPNGSAEPALLNQYLRTFCNNDLSGRAVCDGFLTPPGTDEQVVNLWRVPSFVAGALTVQVEKPDLETIRDWVTQGSPVLVALDMETGGAPAGSHFVVATGVSASGSILIHDPAPHIGRATLGDLLVDFAAAGRTFRGRVSAAVRLVPGVTPEGGFLVAGTAGFDLTAAAGACGTPLQWLGGTLDGRVNLWPPAEPLQQSFCYGSTEQHLLETKAAHRLIFTDMGVPAARQDLSGTAAAAYRISRGTVWQAGNPEVALASPNPLVNAATLTPNLAPGSLLAIFGFGLSVRGATTLVEIAGRSVPVTPVGSFRLNVPIPADMAPGVVTVLVRSALGSAQADLNLLAAAPAIFSYSPQQGAVFNSDGQPNRPDQPASRGGLLIVYATGLGAGQGEGPEARLQIPVRAYAGGTELLVRYAGPAAGFPGVYQVNLEIPLATPPGTALPLVLGQGELLSNAVPVSIQ